MLDFFANYLFPFLSQLVFLVHVLAITVLWLGPAANAAAIEEAYVLVRNQANYDCPALHLNPPILVSA